MYISVDENEIINLIQTFKTKKCTNEECVLTQKGMMEKNYKKLKSYYKQIKCPNYHNYTDRRRIVIKDPSEIQDNSQDDLSQSIQDLTKELTKINGDSLSADQSSIFMSSDKSESEIYQNFQDKNYQTFKQQESKLAYNKDPCPNTYKCKHFVNQFKELDQQLAAPKENEEEKEKEEEHKPLDQDKICVFNHNDMEFLYHPNIYKTYECDYSQKNKPCKLKNCPFFHETEEKRKVDDFLYDVQKWRTIKPEGIYQANQLPGENLFDKQEMDSSVASSTISASLNSSKLPDFSYSQNGKVNVVQDSKRVAKKSSKGFQNDDTISSISNILDSQTDPNMSMVDKEIIFETPLDGLTQDPSGKIFFTDSVNQELKSGEHTHNSSSQQKTQDQSSSVDKSQQNKSLAKKELQPEQQQQLINNGQSKEESKENNSKNQQSFLIQKKEDQNDQSRMRTDKANNYLKKMQQNQLNDQQNDITNSSQEKDSSMSFDEGELFYMQKQLDMNKLQQQDINLDINNGIHNGKIEQQQQQSKSKELNPEAESFHMQNMSIDLDNKKHNQNGLDALNPQHMNYNTNFTNSDPKIDQRLLQALNKNGQFNEDLYNQQLTSALLDRTLYNIIENEPKEFVQGRFLEFIESETIEFKCFDQFDQEKISILVNLICGFMNSGKGGTIFIGVNDNRKIIGQALNSKAIDGIQLDLSNQLKKCTPQIMYPKYKFNFIQVSASNGQKVKNIYIWKIQVGKQPYEQFQFTNLYWNPDQSLYVRQANSNPMLKGPQIQDFILNKNSVFLLEQQKKQDEQIERNNQQQREIDELKTQVKNQQDQIQELEKLKKQQVQDLKSEKKQLIDKIQKKDNTIQQKDDIIIQKEHLVQQQDQQHQKRIQEQDKQIKTLTSLLENLKQYFENN